MERVEIETAIRTINDLLQEGNPSEPKCQEWFELHTVVFTCLGFDRHVPHPVLPAPRDYIPDFMVRNVQGIWSILELKTPDAAILKDSERRQNFYAPMGEYLEQCRDYARYFDDQANRDLFRDRNGFEVQKEVSSIIVVGRTAGLDRVKVHQLLAERGGKVELLTFDDIRDRLEFYRAKLFPRSEKLPGWTYYAVVELHKGGATKRNFLFDVGHKRSRNRISLFIDGDDRLCLEIVDNNGDAEPVRMKIDGRRLAYNRLLYLLIEIGISDDYACIGVDIGGFHYAFRRLESLDIAPQLELVIGSDMRGRADSDFWMHRFMISDGTLAFSKKSQMLDYFANEYASPPCTFMRFRRHRFLRTRLHRRFPYVHAKGPERITDSDAVQPVLANRPALVHWIGSGGGPLIVGTSRFAHSWGGRGSPEHERACQIDDQLARIPLSEGSLVLGGAAYRTASATTVGGFRLIRWVEAKHEYRLWEAVDDVPATAFVADPDLHLVVEPSDTCVVFDAAEVGGDLGDRLEHPFSPGRYSVSTAVLTPDPETIVLVHQFILDP